VANDNKGGVDALSEFERMDESRKIDDGSGQPAARTFKLIPFYEVPLSTDPPFRVRDIVPRVGLVVVYGEKKCGKTYWTYDLMMHVARGQDYRGHKVIQGPIVYVAAEGGNGVGHRIHAYRQTRIKDETEPIPFYLLQTRLDLVADTLALVSSIQLQIKEGGCAAIVVDTLNRTNTGSESSDEDMGAYIKAADRLIDVFKCAVILIHHSGHDRGKGPRGHTSLPAAADAQIVVTKSKDGIIKAEVEFLKDGEGGVVTFSYLQEVEVAADVNGDPIKACIVMEADEPFGDVSNMRVTGQPKRALEILKAFISHEGVDAPAGIDTGKCRVVNLNQWRKRCDDGRLAGSDNPDTSRKAFNRARDQLRDARLININGDCVWLIG